MKSKIWYRNFISVNQIDVVSGFADAIQKLANSPDTRKRMGEYNKTLALQYDVEAIVEQMKGIYKQ